MRRGDAKGLTRTIIERFAEGGVRWQTGEVVIVSPDRLLIHDAYLTDIESCLLTVGGRPRYPEKVVIAFDHAVPPSTVVQANSLVKGLSFVRDQGFPYSYPFEGICHQVMAERGHFVPASLVVATDSHIVSAGAFGTLGIAISPVEAVEVMVTGKTWLTIPELVEIEITGELPGGVSAKDLSLLLLRLVGGETATGKAVELWGSAVEDMGVDGRLTFCTMMAESGCFSALMFPNRAVWEFLQGRLDDSTLEVVKQDFLKLLGSRAESPPDLRVDCSSLGPQVAAPFGPTNVHDVSELEGERITQGFIGSCAGGRYEDLAIAAQVLRGKRIPPNARLIVNPASREVAIRALRSGVFEILYEAGAIILNPGCGLCGGFHQGLVADGDVMISTQTRNFKGRSGSSSARIFLASAATVAASVLEGVICDPRRFLEP